MMPSSTNQQPVSTRQAILELYREAIKSGVSIEDVQTELREFDSLVKEVQVLRKKDKKLTTKYYHVRRIVPVSLITVGSILVANALWPIIYFSVFISPSLQRSNLAAPVPKENVIAATTQTNFIEGAKANELVAGELIKPKAKPVILRQQLDYTNLANWFRDSSTVEQEVAQLSKEYYIEIPKLGVERTDVKVGGTDLNKSLIQYPGTANPGDFGSPVIFGHSVLRQFYRPELSNPNRLKSIFSKIMTLEPGDKIYVTYDTVRYTYSVQQKSEVTPEDTYILEQTHSRRELKLVTCVPEGTYLHRGIVRAVLEKIE